VTGPEIVAIRTRYRDTWFASTLEADWAATFDAWDWYWEYEPLAVKLPSDEAYRPDFRLPAQRVWAEAKGPHNERLHKAAELQASLAYDEWDWASDLVVVLRPPGQGEYAQWEGVQEGQDIVVVCCPECGRRGFMDYSGHWTCRYHVRVQREPNKFWVAEGGALYFPGELPFTRAPRPGRRSA
jgi:hypothetical protein